MKSAGWVFARFAAVASLLLGLALVAPASAAGPKPDARTRPSAAPAPNPVLNARIIRGGRAQEAELRALKIDRLNIRVDVVGRTAQTTLTATFLNPTADTIEGDFILDLPAGSVVTGYALDVDGKMVDGVIVNRRQGTQAYEARVRAGVDPGLAEVTRTGAFRTHVFPIVPGKGRTVRLSFVTPFGVDGVYALPLASEQPVGRMTVSRGDFNPAGCGAPDEGRETDPRNRVPDYLIQCVEREVSKPGLHVEGVPGLIFHPPGDHREFYQLDNTRLSGVLRITADPATPPVSVSRHHTGQTFVEIADTLPARGVLAPDTQRVRIFWDRSLSHRDDDLAAEIALATRYVETVKPQAVDLVLFNSEAPITKTLSGPDLAGQLRAALKAIDYMGATSLQGVFQRPGPAAGQCLFFSDGVIDLDDFRAEAQGCVLFTVSSANDADRGFLGALARRSGGEHLDLKAINADQAMARLISRNLRVTGVTDAGGRALDFVALPAVDGGFRIVAPAPASGALTVRLSGGAPRTYQMPSGAVAPHDGLGALWARVQLSEMSAQAQPDQKAVEAFARKWSVADGSVVFVVLETARDYANAEIEPPVGMGKPVLEEYRALAAAKTRADAQERSERLDKILSMWTEQRAWWDKDYAVPRGKLSPTGEDERARAAGQRDGPDRDRRAGSPPPSTAPGETSVDGVVVTGSRVVRQDFEAISPVTTVGSEQLELTGAAADDALNELPQIVPGDGRPSIAIEVGAWNPDRPYLKALEAASAADFWSVYRAQEKQYGDIPAFYLDVAEWLFRKGRVEDARRVVANAIELPVADTTTLTILADRLMRYGDQDRAIWVYEKILYLEPDRPQPRRNLALALIARSEAERDAPRAVTINGATVSVCSAVSMTPDVCAHANDQQRALDLLTEVIMRPWDSAYDGIEMISLMEANRIIPRVQAKGGKVELDKRLIALFDTDLRILLEWNTDHTDMDLWVDEPSGERAIYSHPRTVIGGRLSNDMTQGYGPEEYLLRRAMDGQYEVRANVYANDRLNPNGSTTVRARIFRNWGRADQEEQVLEIELTKGEAGTQLVGKITVAPRAAQPRRR